MESKSKKSERKGRRHGRRNTKDDLNKLNVSTNFNLFSLPDDHCLKLIDIDCDDDADFIDDSPENDLVRDENMLLKKQLTEKDHEIKQLQKKFSETSQKTPNMASDIAAVKIVELSRRIRDMTAELESEKTKNKQLYRTVRSLEIQSSSESNNTSMVSNVKPRRDTDLNYKIKEKQMSSQPRLLADAKNDLTHDLREKLNSSQTRLAEYRNTCQSLKKDLKKAHRVLLQEVGDGTTVQNAISGSGWRGRAQQILHLQNKLAELKDQYVKQKGNFDKNNDYDEFKFKAVEKKVSIAAVATVQTADKSLSIPSVVPVETADRSCSATAVVQTAEKSLSIPSVGAVETAERSCSAAAVAAVLTVDKSVSNASVAGVETANKSISVATLFALAPAEEIRVDMADKSSSFASVDYMKTAEKSSSIASADLLETIEKCCSTASVDAAKTVLKRNNLSSCVDIIKATEKSNFGVAVDVRHKEDIKKLEKSRKEGCEKSLSDIKMLEAERQHLKEKWLASKSRIQILNNENKQYKVRISALMSKGNHDDELIKAFTDQMSVLQRKTKQLKSLHETDLDVNELKKEYEDEAERLRTVIRDREDRIIELQDEVKSIKNFLSRHSDTSVSSQGSNSAPVFRSTSTIAIREATSSEFATDSRNGVLPELGEIDSDIEELHIMCHEYRTVARAAQVEKEKLLELVNVLNKRVEEATERAIAAEERVHEIQLRNVQLEKQTEMANLEASGNSSRRCIRPTKDVIVSFDELKSNIQLLKDEKEVLKVALHNILQAKEDDLNVYQGIISHAQEIFTKGLREHKER